MTPSVTKEKLINEINLMSDESLSEAYKLIKFIRTGSKKTEIKDLDILSFSGVWKDMNDDIFADLIGNVSNRRHTAFKARRNNAASLN